MPITYATPPSLRYPLHRGGPPTRADGAPRTNGGPGRAWVGVTPGAHSTATLYALSLRTRHVHMGGTPRVPRVRGRRRSRYRITRASKARYSSAARAARYESSLYYYSEFKVGPYFLFFYFFPHGPNFISFISTKATACSVRSEPLNSSERQQKPK